MRADVLYRDNQWDELFEPLLQHRRVYDDRGNFIGDRKDVDCASMFMVFGTGGDTLIHPDQISVAEKFIVPHIPTVHNAVNLFWNIYKPQIDHVSVPNVGDFEDEAELYRLMNPPAPTPSAQLDGLLLECLDWVYDKFQVPYEPDSDNAEKLLDLVIELHIAAARAFKLKQIETDVMSEEWVSSLRSIERTVRRVEAITSSYGSPYWYPSFALSTDAILGMTQLELSRVSRTDGSYADAIDYLTQSAYSYVGAFDYKGKGIEAAEVLLGIDILGNAGPDDKHGGNPWTSSLNWDEDTTKNQEMLARREIESRWTPLQVSLEEVASLFNLLKQSAPTNTNWREIAEDCEVLAVVPLMERDVFTGVEDFIENEGENFLSWSEFWHSAGAYASARMSPSDLEEYYSKTRETEAETRLKSYFFGSDWPHLPQRARKSLITADLTLNSRERNVRREAIDNELRIATEELCHLVVWQLLASSKTPPLEFIGEKLKLDEQPGQSDLGISDYIRICRAAWYRDFLVQQNLDRDDVRFLTKQLPEDMSQLRSGRNSAEHEIGASAAPDSPQSFYRGFLGIGRPGVLPQLARIGRKLQSHRP